jgi:hypothetical protein
MSRRGCAVVSVLALGAIACVLGGCTGLTPELRTMSQRPVDSRNMFRATWNENVRMAWEDFHRGALYERPSRMAAHPTGR